MNPVRISKAIPMITAYIKAGLVPMLVGSPGCGKSQIVYQIANTFNLKVIDLRLSQCDPTDLAGFPTIVNGKADYVPMKHFPIEGDDLPIDEDGKVMAGWLLFLDEATSAPPAIQAASYKLILDKAVGSHKLHKCVAIVAAGNKETDGAIVEPMSTALQSRLAHLELQVCPDEWNDWAATQGIDHRISAYIRWKPGQLYTFKPDHTDSTYACPRTWEFADRILKGNAIENSITKTMLAGVLSEGVALEFASFCNIYTSLPKLVDILAKPKEIPVPDSPSVLFALTGSLAHNATADNLKPIIEFLERIPVEFQIVCIRETIRRNPSIMSSPVMQKWIAAQAAELF